MGKMLPEGDMKDAALEDWKRVRRELDLIVREKEMGVGRRESQQGPEEDIVEELKRGFAQLAMQKTPPLSTQSELEQFDTMKNKVRRRGMLKGASAEEVGSDESILASAALTELKAKSGEVKLKEKTLCDGVVPLIAAAVQDDAFKLYDSQEHQWPGEGGLKPDFFVAASVGVVPKSEPQGDSKAQEEENVPGSDLEVLKAVPRRGFREFVPVVFEAKWSDQRKAASELYSYLRRLPEVRCGIAFSTKGFEVFFQVGESIVEIWELCAWDAPNSVGVLRKAISKSVADVKKSLAFEALSDLASQFQVTPISPLGASHSLVFKCRRQDRNEVALKVFMGDDAVTKLAEERSVMIAARRKGAPVALVFNESDVKGCDKWAGYLLEAGSPDHGRPDWNGASSKLLELHQKGVMHGDPRLPNLLWIEVEWRWIDLQLQPDLNRHSLADDVCKLWKSFNGLHQTDATPDAVRESAKEYGRFLMDRKYDAALELIRSSPSLCS